MTFLLSSKAFWRTSVHFNFFLSTSTSTSTSTRLFVEDVFSIFSFHQGPQVLLFGHLLSMLPLSNFLIVIWRCLAPCTSSLSIRLSVLCYFVGSPLEDEDFLFTSVIEDFYTYLHHSAFGDICNCHIIYLFSLRPNDSSTWSFFATFGLLERVIVFNLLMILDSLAFFFPVLVMVTLCPWYLLTILFLSRFYIHSFKHLWANNCCRNKPSDKIYHKGINGKDHQ